MRTCRCHGFDADRAIGRHRGDIQHRTRTRGHIKRNGIGGKAIRVHMAGAIHMREGMQVPPGSSGLPRARVMAFQQPSFDIPTEMAGLHRR